MKFKNVAVLGMALSLLLVSACDNLNENLPEWQSSKTYSYDFVVRDICSKKERVCLFTNLLNQSVVAFIDNGFLFVIKEGDVDVPAYSLYFGVGQLKQIMPYRNVYMVLTQQGTLALADAEKNLVKLVNGCSQVEIQKNDIVAVRKKVVKSLDGEQAMLSELVVFDAQGEPDPSAPLTYDPYTCDRGVFRSDIGLIKSRIICPSHYDLAESNMVAVYSVPANNSKAPKALKIVNGVLKVELADGEVVPYKRK